MFGVGLFTILVQSSPYEGQDPATRAGLSEVTWIFSHGS